MNRKQRREAVKQANKDGDSELSEKISLFGKLGDNCLTCDKPFDKTNKEMVMSWSVVVKEQEGVVRLYCPECWARAIEIMEDFKQRLEEREE
jgi:hypothetical protein